jgi:hypothetical protein
LRAAIAPSGANPIKFALRGSPFGHLGGFSASDFENKHPLIRDRVRPSGFEPETCGLRVRGRESVAFV